jgi:hypothetical protein
MTRAPRVLRLEIRLGYPVNTTIQPTRVSPALPGIKQSTSNLAPISSTAEVRHSTPRRLPPAPPSSSGVMGEMAGG